MHNKPEHARSYEMVWLNRARSGDVTAARNLVERFGQCVYGFARRITQRADAAEEILTTVFLSALSDSRDCPEDTNVCLWLLTIAVAEVRSRFSEQSQTDRLQDDRADRGMLELALRNLELTDRLVFVLSDIEGMPIEHSARATGLATAPAKQSLLRARLQLRKQLAGRFTMTDAPPRAESARACTNSGTDL